MRILLFALLTLAGTACWGPAPGQGDKAERGYRRAEPIIAALDSFRNTRHTYPHSLAGLVPRWLPGSALAPPRRSQENYPWVYTRSDTAYSLEFRYVGPGMNECVYTVPHRRWSFAGRF